MVNFTQPRILYITCSACLDKGKPGAPVSKPTTKPYEPIARIVCPHCLKDHN